MRKSNLQTSITTAGTFKIIHVTVCTHNVLWAWSFLQNIGVALRRKIVKHEIHNGRVRFRTLLVMIKTWFTITQVLTCQHGLSGTPWLMTINLIVVNLRSLGFLRTHLYWFLIVSIQNLVLSHRRIIVVIIWFLLLLVPFKVRVCFAGLSRWCICNFSCHFRLLSA